MVATERKASLDGPWMRGGITVTCTRAPAPELAGEFWPLYEEAFGPLRALAAARQVLTEDEFQDEVRDERVWKYVAHDENSRMIGLTTLTDDLSSVPWISPEYFHHRYPEEAARNAIFYMGMTLVKPDMRDRPVFFDMLRPTVQRVAARSGVCAYDVCGHNDTSFSFGAGIERLLHRLAKVDVAAVDVQTYYAVKFSGELTRLGAA